MYFYCSLALFSKQSMKKFGPCKMIYLSFTEWTTAHFCNPNNISMKAWAALLSGHKTLCWCLSLISLCVAFLNFSIEQMYAYFYRTSSLEGEPWYQRDFNLYFPGLTHFTWMWKFRKVLQASNINGLKKYLGSH